MPHGAIPFPFGDCLVCNAKATGVHYGVASCEGCKGFFKRSIPKAEKYRCVNKHQCKIRPDDRKRCKSCRFKKCLIVGMSIEGVKMGRIPKAQKQKALEHHRAKNVIDKEVDVAAVLNVGEDLRVCSGNDEDDDDDVVRPESSVPSCVRSRSVAKERKKKACLFESEVSSVEVAKVAAASESDQRRRQEGDPLADEIIVGEGGDVVDCDDRRMPEMTSLYPLYISGATENSYGWPSGDGSERTADVGREDQCVCSTTSVNRSTYVDRATEFWHETNENSERRLHAAGFSSDPCGSSASQMRSTRPKLNAPPNWHHADVEEMSDVPRFLAPALAPAHPRPPSPVAFHYPPEASTRRGESNSASGVIPAASYRHDYSVDLNYNNNPTSRNIVSATTSTSDANQDSREALYAMLPCSKFGKTISAPFYPSVMKELLDQVIKTGHATDLQQHLVHQFLTVSDSPIDFSNYRRSKEQRSEECESEIDIDTERSQNSPERSLSSYSGEISSRRSQSVVSWDESFGAPWDLPGSAASFRRHDGSRDVAVDLSNDSRVVVFGGRSARNLVGGGGSENYAGFRSIGKTERLFVSSELLQEMNWIKENERSRSRFTADQSGSCNCTVAPSSGSPGYLTLSSSDESERRLSCFSRSLSPWTVSRETGIDSDDDEEREDARFKVIEMENILTKLEMAAVEFFSHIDEYLQMWEDERLGILPVSPLNQVINPTRREICLVYNCLITSVSVWNNRIFRLCANIPRFSELDSHDRAALIEAAYFDLWLIGTTLCCFDGEWHQRLPCGARYTRAWMRVFLPDTLIKSIFDFCEELNNLRLTRKELVILCALQLTNYTGPVKSRLRSGRHVQNVHDYYLDLLAHVVERNHPSDERRHTLIRIFHLLPTLIPMNVEQVEAVLNFDADHPPDDNFVDYSFASCCDEK